jgi:hypothetical protein
MLGEKKVLLDGREQDLSLHEAALVEAQTWEINPQDNREELVEFIELWSHLHDVKVDHVVEARWLVILVRDMSKVLVDLGMPPPLPGITWDPRIAGDILEVVDIILESLQEAYASGHSAGIRHRSVVAIVSVIRPALAFCFIFSFIS